MSIGEYCNREVVIIGREENVLEAARLMRQCHVGDVVVVEDRGGRKIPVGILTDRDIVIELVAKKIDPESVRVGDVMSDQLFTVNESDDLLGTVERMHEKAVRRTPVVSETGELAGILTLGNVLSVISETLNDMVLLTGREQQRERETRT